MPRSGPGAARPPAPLRCRRGRAGPAQPHSGAGLRGAAAPGPQLQVRDGAGASAPLPAAGAGLAWAPLTKIAGCKANASIHAGISVDWKSSSPGVQSMHRQKGELKHFLIAGVDVWGNGGLL